MRGPRGYLLVDANVLIDSLAADLSVLARASQSLGDVHILSTVLDEVEGLDTADCERLGLNVVEPELAQLTEAAERRSTLSAQDHLCLVVARARGWTCVTNDGALRRACTAEDVAVLWGLEVMTELVRLVQLSAEDAIAVARAIHESNPLHIPDSLVERFARVVRAIERERRGG